MEVSFMSDFKEINITELTASPYNLFNKDWALLTSGDSKNFNTMTVSWGGVGVLWNKNVATVSKTGKITAVAPGVATITATTKDTNITATCKVKVLPKGTSIKIFSSHAYNQTNMYLKKGKTYSFKTNVYPAEASQSVTYASSNKQVVTISSGGKMKAVGAGSATITVKAKYGSGKKTFKVYVTKKYIYAKKLVRTASSYTVKAGSKVRVKIKISPANSSERLRYTSSNKDVATISKNGFAKGIKKGTVTITATSSKGKKVKCKVKVI